MEKNTAIRTQLYLMGGIVILTFIVYSQALWHDFINYDDPSFVISNPYVRNGVSFDAIRQVFSTSYESNWIPLTWISHMLDVQLFGMNPTGHHLVNILLHAASTVLLFTVLRLATGKLWESAAVAFLFAIHPLHVESVAWVAERKDVLSGFFWMLTLLAYVLYTKKPGLTRYAAVLAAFSLGLLAKPMLVSLPLVLLLLDYWPLRRFSSSLSEPTGTEKPSDSLKALVGEKVPLIALSLGISIVTYLSQKNGIAEEYTLLARVAKGAIAYVSYLGKTLLPINLSIIYPETISSPSLWKVFFSCFFLLLVTIVAFLKRNSCPYIVIGWMWYLITLIPVIGFVPIGYHAMADRYTYLPLIGLFLAAVWSISFLYQKSRLPHSTLKIISATALMLYVTLTLQQLRNWKNSVTIFRHALAVTDANWIAHNNLATALAAEGKEDEALVHFLETVKIKPSYASAHMNLGFALARKGEYQTALEAFNRALILDPKSANAHLGRGLVYLDLRRKDLAVAECQVLQNLEPKSAQQLLELIKDYEKNSSLQSIE